MTSFSSLPTKSNTSRWAAFGIAASLLFVVALHLYSSPLDIQYPFPSLNSLYGSSALGTKVVFGGVIVNSGFWLQRDIVTFYSLASLWHLEDFRIHIVLGPSNDDSLRILKDFRKIDPTHFDYTYNEQEHGDRTTKLAGARNQMLDVIHKRYPDFDYYLNVDGDDKFPERLLDHHAIVRGYLDRSDWDGLFFNRDCYYDIWALRSDAYPDNCCGGGDFEADWARPRVSERSNYYDALLKGKEPDDWQPVHSAFGGLGIYRIDKTIDARYSGVDENGKTDCEHVPFHRDMEKKHDAKLFISPLKMGTCLY